MRYLDKLVGLCFHDPDRGGAGGGTQPASGGAGGNGSGAGSGTGTDGGVATLQQEPPNLLADIELDQLEPAVREVLEKAQATVKTTHTAAATFKRQADQLGETSRKQQSRADQAEARLKRVSGAAAGQEPNAPAPDPYLEETRVFLKTQGLTDDQVEANAKLLGGLMKHITERVVRPGLGHELAPMANAVVAQQATNAFVTAQSSPEAGQFLAIPEVAQAVWGLVTEQANAGQAISKEAIDNLAKMHAMDHYTKHGFPSAGMPATPPTGAGGMPATPPGFSTGGTSYPGAAFASVRPTTVAAQAEPNSETKTALMETFGILARSSNGVMPKGLGGTGKATR